MSTCVMARPLALRVKYFLEEHWHATRRFRGFVMRNLDMFGTMAALILLAVMERVTALHPPL